MGGAGRWEGWSGAALARRLGLPEAEVHRELSSSNDRARAMARSGAPHLALVVADEQTAGRGRGGKGWQSPPGCGVWASVVVRGPLGAGAVELLPLRVGLSLARGLEGLVEAPLALKWPNDVFLRTQAGEGKVGGILCERAVAHGEGGTGALGAGDAVIVGVGVNVFPVRLETGYPTADLLSVGVDDRLAVLTAVVESIRTAAAAPEPSLSAEELAEWARRDILHGRAVRIMGRPAGQEKGIARGVDPRGRLVVDTRFGRIHVVGGSVHPLDAVSGDGDVAPGGE